MRLTATAFDLTRPLRGDAVLAVSITAKSEPDAMELIDGQKSGKLYDVTITEHREHRSTTANAYFHKLASELAKVLKTDIDSVKKHFVRLYGTPAEEDGYPITVNVAKGVDPSIFYPYYEWLSGDEYSDTYFLFKQTHTLNTAEFSHLTHTIDISSLDKNTTAPQVLTNFNPLSAKEAQKDAMFKRSLLVTLALIAIGLFSLVVSVLVKVLTR